MNVLRRVCVFCGSSRGGPPVYADAARALGRAMARRNIGLVYGGGNIGLMGVVADAVLSGGGEVLGVIPFGLERREVAHAGLTKLFVTRTMHERKAKMADLSDAFVALPGGLGTLDELCEVLTWAQLGIHAKPIALLDVNDYFRAFKALLDHAVSEGFLLPENRALLLEEREVEVLLDRLASVRTPRVPRWVEPEQR
jgi:uncharacterized protein (TIGR00730 family)